ncbi:MAG: response regulator [Cyclobacteriaceae bacterium]
MSKKIHCILLVDDNPDDNFFHERVIMKNDFADFVIAKESGLEALDFLKQPKDSKIAHPNLIFLDINMPGMNGWEFLEEYDKLDKDQQSQVIMVMLTSSQHTDDIAQASTKKTLADFKTKPLTEEMLDEIMDKYF